MQRPAGTEKLFADIATLQSELANRASGLPANPAKTLITELLAVIGPMATEFAQLIPEALDETEAQLQKSQSQLEEVKARVAKAQADLENVPPTQEIRKNLIPEAKPMPLGHSKALAAEMRTRYRRPASPGSLAPSEQGAAWQDWVLG